jgi:hypothetical protein
MRHLSWSIGIIWAVALSGAANAQFFDDPFNSQYLERGITITPGAGNAKDANAAIHTIDPWPRYVGTTRIPGDGRRSVNAVEQMYRAPNPFSSQPPGVPLGTGTTSSTSTGGSSTTFGSSISTGVATPMQPISSGGY